MHGGRRSWSGVTERAGRPCAGQGPGTPRRGGGAWKKRGEESLTRGEEAGAAESWGRAGAWGREGGGFRSRAERRGPSSRTHLKSLSLDVIFSRRLEMWKAAVLMVAAPRGRRRERIWRREAPSPAARGLRSAARNSSPRPAQPRRARLGLGRRCGRRKGPARGSAVSPGASRCPGPGGRPITGLHTPTDGELTTSQLTPLPYSCASLRLCSGDTGTVPESLGFEPQMRL